MEFKSMTGTLSIDKFKKCGEVYRSAEIREKQYMFLSCIYCKDISWELDTFLQHLDTAHQTIDDLSIDIFKENDIIECSPIAKNITDLERKYSPTKTTPPTKCDSDPLDEDHYDYSQLMPAAIIVETLETNECCHNNSKTDLDAIKKSTNNINEILDVNSNEDSKENGSDEEPDKITTEDESGEYHNEEYDQEDIDNDDVGCDVVFDQNQYNKKTSLKRFTKNRDFIKAIIIAYRKQNVLWDRTYKTKSGDTTEIQESLKKILNGINEKFQITATAQQIERIIKRLKLRFVHHLRLKDKGESYKPLWFFDLLKFLEPHLKENKMKRGLCKQLNDNQLLALIKLLKENECFWNENNIYHTSVINKQDILRAITSDYSKMFNFKELNDDIMQNTIDEIIEMAKEENTSKIKHIESNSNDDEYKSSNKFYKEIEFLLPHVGPFICKYCQKIFNDIYSYKFHISKHEGTKPFKCMQCPRELTHKKEFVCHLRRHTKECPFQCNSCDKSFPSQKEWHRHVIKHGSKPYVCELCADSFYTQHQLTNHMKNHNNVRDHVCPECGKGFTHRGLLRQHLQTHNKTKCFCTLCDNIYSNPRSLRKHYVRVHESGEQPSAAHKTQYNCQICKISFSTIQDAKQHRKEHKQSNPTERRHVCDICGHHFAYPRNLADHKKTHSNIRDQICDVCGKAFTNANLLNQHKNVHTGEKFVCKACGKDYAHYRGLCRHLGKVHGTNIRDLDALLEKQIST